MKLYVWRDRIDPHYFTVGTKSISSDTLYSGGQFMCDVLEDLLGADVINGANDLQDDEVLEVELEIKSVTKLDK